MSSYESKQDEMELENRALKAFADIMEKIISKQAQATLPSAGPPESGPDAKKAVAEYNKIREALWVPPESKRRQGYQRYL